MANKDLVVLLSPPTRSINHYRPPVALLYLAGHLKRHHVNVKIVDITLTEVVKNQKFFNNIDKLLPQVKTKILSQIIKLKPKIIGITCYTPEYAEVLSLAQKIKEMNHGGYPVILITTIWLKIENNTDY